MIYLFQSVGACSVNQVFRVDKARGEGSLQFFISFVFTARNRDDRVRILCFFTVGTKNFCLPPSLPN